MIKKINGEYRYFDKNGKEITENCYIKFTNVSDGKIQKVYRTTENELGIDATNPNWIASGRAEPTEYGIYPLNVTNTENCEVVEGLKKYISFEVYESPQNPTEHGKYISKTPIYEQKGVTPDGEKVMFL